MSLRRKQVTETDVIVHLPVPTASSIAFNSFFFRPIFFLFLSFTTKTKLILLQHLCDMSSLLMSIGDLRDLTFMYLFFSFV